MTRQEILEGSTAELCIELASGEVLYASMPVTEDDVSRWRSGSGTAHNLGVRLLSMIEDDYKDRVRSGSLEPNTQ